MLNKSMTRKTLIIFALSTIIAYPLFLGVFGPSGYFHNRQVSQKLSNLGYEQEVLSLQVQSLEEQKKQMSSADALKDAAFRFGYQSDGEQVYYFPDEHELDVQSKGAYHEGKPVETGTFEGLSQAWIVLITLAFSLLLTVSYVFVSHRSDSKNEIVE
ncbi:MAG: septum formation initiator family protein [Sphaerochaeta sp.]